MSSIILFDSVKGGVGKSTLLAQFAVTLARQHHIAIMDCDPQGSIQKWAIRRFSNEKYPQNFDLLEADLDFLKSLKKTKEYDYILVDSAGADTETGRAILAFTDIVISPLQPTQSALDTIPAHNQILTGILEYNPNIKVYYLLNDCATHHLDNEAKDAKNALLAFLRNKPIGTVVEQFIYTRKPLKTTYATGSSCFDLRKSKSAIEIENVIKSVLGE